MSLIYGGAAQTILSKLPLPPATDSYHPMSHKQVIALTMEALKQSDLRVISSEYVAARSGKQGMGIYHITGAEDKEMGIRLAWQNSYDKSLALKWAIGANVFVCGNGMFVGDKDFGGTFKRKHTGEIIEDYRQHCGMYVNEAGKLFNKLVIDRERLKEITVTKRTCAELVGRMFLEESIITSTQLNIIKRELEKPSFDYGKGTKGSAWALYNHTTLALKEAHPELYMTQHTDVHNFFTNEYSL